jgi:hypothetical protein
MPQPVHPSFRPRSSRRPNFLALLVAIGAGGFLYINVDPITAGSDPEGVVEALDIAACPPPPPLPTTAGENGGQTASIGAGQNADRLTGRWALLMQTMLLEKGCAAFCKVSDYTATLHKQERIDGTLGEVQTLKVKLRHDPFSVYMKWQTFDPGRELIYVEGQNDGNLLVQPGGWKGRLTGTLSLDPKGSMAMSESRHSVAEAGLVRLAEKLLGYNYELLKRDKGLNCELHANQKVQGRDCFLFIMQYDSPQANKTYRKSIQYVDAELSLPVVVRNYTWGEDTDPETIDEQTLIESYTWTDIRVNQQLANGDFDETNSSYRFRRK